MEQLDYYGRFGSPLRHQPATNKENTSRFWILITCLMLLMIFGHYYPSIFEQETVSLVIKR